MPTGVREDPPRAFNFRVEFEGLDFGSFSECSGLVGQREVVQYREGTDIPTTVRKLAGLDTFDNVVLKLGYTRHAAQLWAWWQNLVNGVMDRRNGAIILLDSERADFMRWSVENAWIAKIEGPTFNATANEIAILSCELAHEGLRLEA